MKKRIRDTGTTCKGSGAAFATVLFLLGTQLPGAAQSNACDQKLTAQLRSAMPSWPLTATSTVDNAQHLADLSGACSAGAGDPQQSAYALIVALANEVKARAQRQQRTDFLSATQTAYVMFRFVANDKNATEADRRAAAGHLKAMGALLGEAGIAAQ
jgi:hypothetical protein